MKGEGEAMKFRPCIDIHNGKVKQIVGGSLGDEGDQAQTNYASEHQAEYYAELYQKDQLTGGHVILLNPSSSPYYEQTREQGLRAVRAYPGGLQIGGGITAENALEYIEAGASHVIVTSYILSGGEILWDHLHRLEGVIGKERLVIDLSCRRRGHDYYIVTDRWQTFTDVRLDQSVLEKLAGHCDEFLIHGVDVEGKSAGFETELVAMLGHYKGVPVTYAGGIGSEADLQHFEQVSGGNLDFTIGSALDLFGGTLSYQKIKYVNSL